MHKRLVSYVLFLATIVAVLMIVVVQPRNAVFHKMRTAAGPYYSAETCMMINGITCEQYAAMMTASSACSGTGGTWDWTNNVCQAPPPLCNGVPCMQMTCEMAGYYWDGTMCYITGPTSNSSSGGTPPSIVDGVGTNERLSQRIESQCLNHVAQSGYASTLANYGWFENVRVYAKNACTLAYLATNGKYGSNNDLYVVASLITNDNAKGKEDVGILYQALENVPAQGKDQSLNDYLDVKKDGAVQRLKKIMDVMSDFNDLTTDQRVKPAYLTEPLPYVTKAKAAAYNAAHGTNIVSLEEKLLALLPQPAEAVAVTPQTPEQKPALEEPAPAPKITAIQQMPQPAEENQSVSQKAVVILTKIVNKLKGIREEGLEKGIERKVITPSLDVLQKDFEYQQAVIKAFDEAHDSLCARLGC